MDIAWKALLTGCRREIKESGDNKKLTSEKAEIEHLAHLEHTLKDKEGNMDHQVFKKTKKQTFANLQK